MDADHRDDALVTINLTRDDALDLFNLLDNRPYEEVWSGRIYYDLGHALGKDIPAHIRNPR